MKEKGRHDALPMGDEEIIGEVNLFESVTVEEEQTYIKTKAGEEINVHVLSMHFQSLK